MQIIIQDQNRYVLRFDSGEEVLGGIKKFCEAEHIDVAFFSGIGASGEVILSYYDLAKKEYQDRAIHERLEIVSLTGNVCALNGEVVLHAHGVFSDSSLKTQGGHVKKLVVSATCEIHLQKLKGRAERRYDKKTGLNLLQ